MDDKLYEAARLQGTHFPFDVDTDELFRLTPLQNNNILHVAARYGNTQFISEVMNRIPNCLLFNLLCKPNTNGETPLHVAAQFGEKETVQTILLAHTSNHRCCWSKQDKDGDTPLHKALRCGHDSIGVLLSGKDKELSVCVNSNVGESAVYLAVANSCIASLEAILDGDGCASFSGPYGRTAFHPARKLTGHMMSKLIQKRGSMLRYQDIDGKTALHYSAEENRYLMVEMLLKADNTLAFLHDNVGLTCLHIAASRGFLSMIRIILELSPQSLPIRDSINGKTALHFVNMDACWMEECLKKTRMQELINEVDNDGNTPLHTALINHNTVAAHKLLDVDGINCSVRNKQDSTPMDLCTFDQNISRKMRNLIAKLRITETVNMEIFFNKDVVHVDDLLDHYDWSKCLTYKGPQGDTILHIAARDGHMKMIQMADESNSALCLLLSGQNSKGETPLHLAARQGLSKVVIYILSKCGPTDGVENGSTNVAIGNQVENVMPWRMRCLNGDTPAHKAVRNRHSSTALLLLHRDPMLLSCTNNFNESILYLAAEYECIDLLKYILSEHRNFGDLVTHGRDGQNVMHAASRILTGVSLCRELLRKQPELLKMVDADGKTPLHYAAKHNHRINTRLLLEHDKSAAFLYDNQGYTPLLGAAALGCRRSLFQILNLCPHSAELRDLTNNGTLLHLAKMSNAILKWALRHKVMLRLLNATDNEGNTALHRAIYDGDIDKALILLNTKGINWKIQNNQNQSPIVLCRELITSGKTDRRPVFAVLTGHEYTDRERAGSTLYYVIKYVCMMKLVMPYANKIMTDENAKKLVDNIAVAAGLLFTITSAAAFAIPGGYDQTSGDAIRIKQSDLKVFMASDVFAMLMCVAILVRYTIGVGGRSHKLRRLAFDSLIMLQISLLAAVVAFISAAYAIASHFKAVVIVPVIATVLFNLILLCRPDVYEFLF